MNAEVQCPLCTQIGFQSVDALRIALVSAASRNLTCPVCNATLTGLDKLTVHLFGHTLPQHDLLNVGQSISINNGSPLMSSSESKKATLTSEESTKKEEISSCSVSQHNFQTFQNEAISERGSQVTSLSHQELSNLLCWLPLTCFPEKSLNAAANTTSSGHCDLINSRTVLQSQQNDGKGDLGQLLGTTENNSSNKDSPFIIVGLPSLQDIRKEAPINSNINELSLSDVTSLSGKLLMLDCSGNSQCNGNIGVTNSSELSNVQISTIHQSIPHPTSANVLTPNQNASLSNR